MPIGPQIGGCWKHKLNEIGRVTLFPGDRGDAGSPVVSFLSIKLIDDKVYACAPENTSTGLPLTINKSETFLCEIQQESE